MKKVNKQCLLDTPRTVIVSERTWQVIALPADLSFEKISEDAYKNFKLLHAYVQCVYIALAKYQIAPSKAVVGVDKLIKALSMHIQKSYKGKNCLSSDSCYFVIFFSNKQTPSCICSMCLYCICKVSKC